MSGFLARNFQSCSASGVCLWWLSRGHLKFGSSGQLCLIGATKYDKSSILPKRRQHERMTIYYVTYIDPFLKRCIDKNSILILIFYKQTKENTKPTIQSIAYYIPTKNIYSYTIYSLGKGKVSEKTKCFKNLRFDLYPKNLPDQLLQ